MNQKIRVAETNKGRSLYTTTNISIGELLFSDDALLCCTPEKTRSLRLDSAVVRKKKSFALMNREIELNIKNGGIITRNDINDGFEASSKIKHLYPQEQEQHQQKPLSVCRASDVLYFNGAELVSCGHTSPLVGVFETLSMINHSCCPNSFYISSWNPIQKTPRADIYALQTINAGEEITFSYVSSSQSRVARQAEIYAGWMFKCDCERCQLAGDDSQVFKCDHCTIGHVPVGNDSRGCLKCLSPFPICGFSDGLVAANTRTDLLFWLENHDYNIPRITNAINALHERDSELRCILESIVLTSIDKFCGTSDTSDTTYSLNFSGDILVTMATIVRRGEEMCNYLPLPQQLLFGKLIEGDAACVAFIQSSECHSKNEWKIKATDAYFAASLVFSSSLLSPFYSKNAMALLASILSDISKDIPVSKSSLQEHRLERTRLLNMRANTCSIDFETISKL
jgi:hypothetical protein